MFKLKRKFSVNQPLFGLFWLYSKFTILASYHHRYLTIHRIGNSRMMETDFFKKSFRFLIQARAYF